jgi:hypothetical protein
VSAARLVPLNHPGIVASPCRLLHHSAGYVNHHGIASGFQSLRGRHYGKRIAAFSFQLRLPLPLVSKQCSWSGRIDAHALGSRRCPIQHDGLPLVNYGLVDGQRWLGGATIGASSTCTITCFTVGTLATLYAVNV